jgi:hypothetical protein
MQPHPEQETTSSDTSGRIERLVHTTIKVTAIFMAAAFGIYFITFTVVTLWLQLSPDSWVVPYYLMITSSATGVSNETLLALLAAYPFTS